MDSSFVSQLAFLLIGSSSSLAWSANPCDKALIAESKETPVHLEVTADFDLVFANRFSETQPPSFPGTIRNLKHPEQTLKMQIRVRGNTSNDPAESKFPKLKLEIDDKENVKNTIFQESRSFKINTHLNNRAPRGSGGLTRIGRVANEKGPWREGLAYELAKTLGLETPGTQLARIRYVNSKNGQRIEKNALLVQTDQAKSRSAGAEIVDYSAFAEGETSGIDPIDGSEFFLFHRMIENDDVMLRVNQIASIPSEISQPIWNTYVLQYPNGKRVPVVYDLDLAGSVTGSPPLALLIPEIGLTDAMKTQKITKICALRRHFTNDQLVAALNRMKAKKNQLYRTIVEAPVDADGRRFAKSHVDVFFEVADLALSYSVIGSSGVQLYKDPAKKESLLRPNRITDEPGTLFRGASIKVLGAEGGMLKVAVIDSFYQLDGTAIGYIEASTPIQSSLTLEQARQIDDREIFVGF